jgi:cytochrome oxidase Cu insertion factor (SCO1/SenC/PrrC family)
MSVRPTAPVGSAGGGLPLRPLAFVLASAALLGVLGGLVVHELRSHSAPVAKPRLPSLHGQAVWPAGERLAPPIELRDQTGARVSLAGLRGRPVLLTFLDSRCHAECPIMGRQIAGVLGGLPAAERPTLLVVSADRAGDTPASIRHALAEWRLAGPWRTYWLNGSAASVGRVWRSYQILVQPKSGDIVHSLALYLIDRRGYERTGYLVPFLPSFVQRDLARLAREERA